MDFCLAGQKCHTGLATLSKVYISGGLHESSHLTIQKILTMVVLYILKTRSSSEMYYCVSSHF